MKERLTKLIAEYGGVAFGTYIVLFILVLAGFAIAIGTGFEVEGVSAGAGTLGAAWLATKLTQPLRIGATLVLTPLVARILRRRGGAPK